MALVLDSTPLSPTQNSYVSLAEMEEYVSTRVVDESVQNAWEALDQPVQLSYLVNATRSLDSICNWIGAKYSRDQLLKWPRVSAWVENFQLDVTTTPTPVKDATCEMALWTVHTSGATSEQGNEALQRIQVGPIRLQFNDNSGAPATRFMPDSVAYILSDLATFERPGTPGANSMRIGHLERG